MVICPSLLSQSTATSAPRKAAAVKRRLVVEPGEGGVGLGGGSVEEAEEEEEVEGEGDEEEEEAWRERRRSRAVGTRLLRVMCVVCGRSRQ